MYKLSELQKQYVKRRVSASPCSTSTRCPACGSLCTSTLPVQNCSIIYRHWQQPLTDQSTPGQFSGVELSALVSQQMDRQRKPQGSSTSEKLQQTKDWFFMSHSSAADAKA
jgi:hypothetical protein